MAVPWPEVLHPYPHSIALIFPGSSSKLLRKIQCTTRRDFLTQFSVYSFTPSYFPFLLCLWRRGRLVDAEGGAWWARRSDGVALCEMSWTSKKGHAARRPWQGSGGKWRSSGSGTGMGWIRGAACQIQVASTIWQMNTRYNHSSTHQLLNNEWSVDTVQDDRRWEEELKRLCSPADGAMANPLTWNSVLIRWNLSRLYYSAR